MNTEGERFFPKIDDIINASEMTNQASNDAAKSFDQYLAQFKAQGMSTPQAQKQMLEGLGMQIRGPLEQAGIETANVAIASMQAGDGDEKVIAELQKVNIKLQTLNETVNKSKDTSSATGLEGMHVTVKLDDVKSFNAHVTSAAYKGIQNKLSKYPTVLG